MPLGDILNLREPLGILGVGTQSELVVPRLNPTDAGRKPDHTVGSGVGYFEPVLEVLAELPEVAPRERRRNQGLRMHHGHLLKSARSCGPPCRVPRRSRPPRTRSADRVTCAAGGRASDSPSPGPAAGRACSHATPPHWQAAP